MTDKFRRAVREFAAKNGMSHQAAHNLLTKAKAGESKTERSEQAGNEGPAFDPATYDPAVKPIASLTSTEMIALMMHFEQNRSHEPDCPLSDWDRKALPEPSCECLGIDYSQPLLDGDDYYDV
jgi:hypothetical protein